MTKTDINNNHNNDIEVTAIEDNVELKKVILYRFEPVEIKAIAHKVDLVLFLVSEMGLSLREDGYARMPKKFQKHFIKIENEEKPLTNEEK